MMSYLAPTFFTLGAKAVSLNASRGHFDLPETVRTMSNSIVPPSLTYSHLIMSPALTCLSLSALAALLSTELLLAR